jgi:4-amino-4-deoxy-L-arabinose transferase-like glycosyltransferase
MTERATSFGPSTPFAYIYSIVVQNAVLVTALAGAILILTLAVSLHDFSYYYGFASAHFATIARAFSQHGIFSSGGIPIENNDPITTEPDTYLHFPPFYFYALSIVIDIFSDSIRAMHFFMAIILIATAVIVWRICRHFLSPEASVFAAAAYLLMPTTLRYGLTLLTVNLALFELVLGLFFLQRHVRLRAIGRPRHLDLAISAFAFFFACLTSWEVYLAIPGIALAILLDRKRELLPALAIWTAAAVVALGLFLSLYIRNDPQFAQDLWSIAAYRAGLGAYTPLPTRLHPVEWGVATSPALLSFGSLMSVNLFRLVRFLGTHGIVGLIVFFAALVDPRSGPERQAIPRIVLLPLAAVWLGWEALMQEHYSAHEYQMILSTPVAAIGLAIAYFHVERQATLAEDNPMRRGRSALLKLALLCAMLLSGADAAEITYRGATVEAQDVAFGQAIKDAVPPGAIVLTNLESMAPVYASERHLIREMRDGAELHQRLPAIRNLCRSCSLYLAISPGSAEKFREIQQLGIPILSNETAIIIKLPEAGP